MLYKVCPICGCSLDPDEKCECQKKKDAPDRTGTPVERKKIEPKSIVTCQKGKCKC